MVLCQKEHQTDGIDQSITRFGRAGRSVSWITLRFIQATFFLTILVRDIVLRKLKFISLGFLFGVILLLLLPEWPKVPVAGATAADWNPAAFWHEPWGASGVHKGIDIFGAKGTPVIAPTYGLVLFRGEIALGGKVAVLLGPKLRVHYFAHLDSAQVHLGSIVRTGDVLGSVGDTGNAQGKQPHLHYAVVTIVPYPWRIDRSSQGWKKMFFLDPFEVLEINVSRITLHFIQATDSIDRGSRTA